MINFDQMENKTQLCIKKHIAISFQSPDSDLVNSIFFQSVVLNAIYCKLYFNMDLCGTENISEIKDL